MKFYNFSWAYSYRLHGNLNTIYLGGFSYQKIEYAFGFELLDMPLIDPNRILSKTHMIDCNLFFSYDRNGEISFEKPW